MKGIKLQREILRLLKILIELQLCASSVQSDENVTLKQMDLVLMGPDLTVTDISTVSKGTVGEKGESTRKTKDALCIWVFPQMQSSSSSQSPKSLSHPFSHTELVGEARKSLVLSLIFYTLTHLSFA